MPEQPAVQDEQIRSSPGHIAMAILLSQRKTGKDLLQRCKVNTGIPQGSKLSPSLFSFYIADMPMPTEPVKRVCYADDLTMWATGVKIPDMEDILNSYLEEITAYLKDDSLLISASKSSVTLFTSDTPKPKPTRKYSLVQCAKILGVHLDTSLSFNKHSSHVAERISRRNNILKALAGGQQKETNDIQGGWEIDHKLCCTCLEDKPTRHQLQKYSIHAK